MRPVRRLIACFVGRERAALVEWPAGWRHAAPFLFGNLLRVGVKWSGFYATDRIGLAPHFAAAPAVNLVGW